MQLVELYNDRQFTIRSDVFPAISGLAKIIAQKTDKDYVAGLWKSDLLRQYLWNGRRGVGSLEKLVESLAASKEDYACPSWSWSGPDWGISFKQHHDGGLHPKCES